MPLAWHPPLRALALGREMGEVRSSGLTGAWRPSLPSGAGGGSARPRPGGTGPGQAWLRIWGGELRTGSAGPAPTSTSAEHRWRSSGSAQSRVSGLDGVEKWATPRGQALGWESGLAKRPSTDTGWGWGWGWWFHPGGASPLMGRETTQAAPVVRGPALHSRSRCCAGRCWAMSPPGHWTSGGGAQWVGWLPAPPFLSFCPS